jgi:hypothetical protein
LKRGLLASGILSSLLYIAMLIFVPGQWKNYSSTSQTVSELSAIGAPTRALWVALGSVYTLLAAIFGLGVWKSANGNRFLKIVGIFIIIYGLLGLFWPPMHQREVLAAGGATLTDTLHIVWTIATVLLMLLAIGFGSMALGKRFRLYSIMTMLILVLFGLLTGMDAPQVQANQPTPLAGVWERINISVFLLWLIVLSMVLLRRNKFKV